ncbi:MAG TPA: protein kinase [Herpetosiphonaceae bacterium]
MAMPSTFQQGRYQVQREQSRDACGVLYLAADTKMAGRTVAIRQLSDGGLSQATLQQIAQLSHATLPSVYDLFEEQGNRYLVLENPSGQTLADIALGPRLREGVIVAWARQIAAGLSYLHSQKPPLAHGDLQPANVLLEDGRRIKLVGGLPAGCANMPLSRYAAPEQLGGGAGGPAADVFALGAIIHHLLTGTDPNTQPLLTFAPADTRRPDLSPGVVQAIARALRADPAERFPSADAFAAALAQGGTGESSGGIPVIGFTPTSIQSPATGSQTGPAADHTQAYQPTPGAPIPTPPISSYGGQYDPYADQPTQYDPYAGQRTQPPGYDQYATQNTQPPGYDQYASQRTQPPGYDQYQEPAGYDPYQAPQGYPPPGGPPPSRLPARPQSQGGRGGIIVIGVLALLVLLGVGGWLVLRPRGGGTGDPTEVIGRGSTTPTREEGRPLSPLEATATARALTPTATNLPTVDTQGTAGVVLTQEAETQATLEALYNSGVALQDQGDLRGALDVFSSLAAQAPQYRPDDVQFRIAFLQDQLNIAATTTAATATAGALPTATFTPVPPTATPVGQVLGDGFDAPALDETRWISETNTGTLKLENSELALAGAQQPCFPYVRSAAALPSGNFDLTIRFRYTAVTDYGTGFMLASEAPENCGAADRAGASWGGVWQDKQNGMRVEFHRDDQDGNPPKDIRRPVGGAGGDTGEHTLRIERRADIVTYYFDEELLFPEPIGKSPTVLWFGNPVNAGGPVDWTDLSILEVDLRQTP